MYLGDVFNHFTLGDLIMVAKSEPLFSLGQVIATPQALEAIEKAGDSLHTFIRKHHTGNWGDVCEEDKSLNEAALQDGSRLLSAYKTSKGEKIWIITEADRSVTTALLPEEY